MMGEGGQHIPNFELVSLGHFTIEAMLNYGTIMIFFKVNHYTYYGLVLVSGPILEVFLM